MTPEARAATPVAAAGSGENAAAAQVEMGEGVAPVEDGVDGFVVSDEAGSLDEVREQKDPFKRLEVPSEERRGSAEGGGTNGASDVTAFRLESSAAPTRRRIPRPIFPSTWGRSGSTDGAHAALIRLLFLLLTLVTHNVDATVKRSDPLASPLKKKFKVMAAGLILTFQTTALLLFPLAAAIVLLVSAHSFVGHLHAHSHV